MRSKNIIGIFVAICTCVAVVPDATTKTETVPDGEKGKFEFSKDFKVSLEDSLTGDLGEVMVELVGVVADFGLEILDQTLSEDSVNAALEKAWTTQAEPHDTNRDGGLSRDEASKIPDFRLDDDGNELSDEEFDELLNETFETIDLDEDGKITKEETQTYLKSLTDNVSEWIDTAKVDLETKSASMFESKETPSDSESDK